mgnify:FL=1
MFYLLTSIQQHPPADGLGRLLEYIIDFYSHGIDEHLMVAATFWVIFLDISLGYIRGWACKEFSSTTSRKGLGSHAFVFVTVAISYPLAILANVSTEADMFIYYLFFSYAASILKNGEAIGIKIPFITKYVSDRVDPHKDKDEDKETETDDSKNEK